MEYAFRVKYGSTAVVLLFVGGRRKHSIKKIMRRTSPTTWRKLAVTASVMKNKTECLLSINFLLISTVSPLTAVQSVLNLRSASIYLHYGHARSRRWASQPAAAEPPLCVIIMFAIPQCAVLFQKKNKERKVVKNYPEQKRSTAQLYHTAKQNPMRRT